jgi:multidrug efflux pump
VPKGFFPQQDSGQIQAGLRADQSVSFHVMQAKLRRWSTSSARTRRSTPWSASPAARGPAAASCSSISSRWAGRAQGQGLGGDQPPAAQLQKVTGISVFLNPVQDVRMGGRQSNSTYQYTLTSDSSDALKAWAPKLAEAMKARSDVMTDVDSDQSENGVETFVTIDRDSASRMGVTPRAVDNALYNAFGQRQVATIYEDINQYAVIMEWDRRFSKGPEALNDVYVPTTSGDQRRDDRPAARRSIRACATPRPARP